MQVVDTQKWQRYLVQDAEGRRWRLFAQHSYALGDQLFLSAFASPRNDEQVFGSRAWQFRTPEFWEYAFNYDTWLFMHHIAGTLYEQQSLLVSDPASASMMGMKALSGSLGMLDSLRAQLQSFVQSVYGATPYA